MRPLMKYTLITATRDLLFIGLFIVILVAIGISYFLGNTSMIETRAMVVSYAAFSSRFILVTGLIVFVCFHVRRAFENKEIEVQLSRPISRFQFVIEYWLGFVVLTLLVTIPVIAVMAFIAPANVQSLMLWGLSIVVEGTLMVAFALVTSLILQSAVSPVLLSLGFYVVSRMMGYFMATTKIPHYYQPSIIVDHLSEYVVMATSMFLPRLDFFGKSEWLIYGISAHATHDLILFIIQAAVYIPFLLGVAIFDFKRKQF
ncbi:MAG: hypothetical protein IPP74_04590 [Alphaproteobacteria bacterium]|nr:hypothetical protein [Alphaproteobacteria bacterium]